MFIKTIGAENFARKYQNEQAPQSLPEEMAKRVAQITDAGYRVKQFETFHYRFESAVDFWPSSGG